MQCDFKIRNGELRKYHGRDGAIVVPEVSRICKDAFANSEVRSVTLPEGLKRIEQNAFLNCALLEEVVIPEGVEYIGYSAFEGCRNLKTIVLPPDIYIEADAFHGCEALAKDEMIIVNGILFHYLGRREKVLVPDGVTEIGIRAFCGNRDVSTVLLPNTCQKIHYRAFDGCFALRETIMPRSLQDIDKYAYPGGYRRRCMKRKT